MLHDLIFVLYVCSVRVDKARELCEQRVRSGQQNAERLEQALLSEKMVRKLKESQLARLKNSRAKKGTSCWFSWRAFMLLSWCVCGFSSNTIQNAFLSKR